MFRWRLVTSSVPQGSILGPALLIVFINVIESGIKCTLSKVTDDTKLSAVVDTPEGRDNTQMDLDTFKKWGHESLMGFNKANCRPCIWIRAGWRMKGLTAPLPRRTWGHWFLRG